MRRRILGLLASISIATAVAAVACWIRSTRVAEMWLHSRHAPTTDRLFRARIALIGSSHGKLWVGWWKMNWEGPAALAWAKGIVNIDSIAPQGWKKDQNCLAAAIGFGTARSLRTNLGFEYAHYNEEGPTSLGEMGWAKKSPDILWYSTDLTMVAIPHWFVLTLSLVVPAYWLFSKLRDKPKPGHCPACGYDLRASVERCPECGEPVPDAKIP